LAARLALNLVQSSKNGHLFWKYSVGGIKDAEFYAEFKSIEKIAKKFNQKVIK
jgi:hypothetical protein